MDRFEKLLLPIILLVGIAAILLGRAEPDTAMAVARTIGIALVVLLVVGFVARTAVKVRRARRRAAELLAEMQDAAQKMAEPAGPDDEEDA